MALPNMQAQTAALNANLASVQQSARQAGQEMEELSKSVFSYGKALLTLTASDFVKAAVKWGFDQIRLQQQMLVHAKANAVSMADRVNSQKTMIAAMQASGKYSTQQIEAEKKILQFYEARQKFHEEEAAWREKIPAILKQEGEYLALSAGYLLALVRSYRVMIGMFHDYNSALIQADSRFGARYELIKKTTGVQRELGASTQSMSDSAQALVAYGNHLTPAYASNLKLVTQMKEGLGLSARSGAELVVVFSRQLRESAEKVANVVAQIAANTGLAADKAAQYATEIGRALRLIGPQGLGKEAAGVARTIGTLAGRVEALGGNSSAVVALFRQMAGGSDQSAILRRMTRTSISGIGTEAGALEAMRRVVNLMSMRVNAADPEMYRFQLEQLSSEIGVSANDLADLRQVVQEWNKDMDKTRTAAQAFDEQTRLVGESWSQIKTALRTMVSEALLPLMKAVQPLISDFASLVKSIASYKPLVTVLSVALPLGAVVAGVAVYKLTRRLYEMALANEFAAATMNKMGLPALNTFGTKIKSIAGIAVRGSSAVPMTTGLMSGWGAMAGSIGTVGTLAVTGIAVAGAGLIGAAVGRAIDKAWPSNPIAQMARTLGEFHKDYQANTREEWIRANAGGNALMASRRAARMMAETEMGLTSKADTEAAVRAAQKKLMALDAQYWTPQRSMAVLTKNAIADAQMLGMVNQYAGFQQKTAEDRKQDERYKVAVKQLELLSKQYKEQADARQAQQDAVMLKRKELDDAEARKHWESTAEAMRRASEGRWR